MSAAFRAFRVGCLCSAMLAAFAADTGCRHRNRTPVAGTRDQTPAAVQPATTPAGAYRVTRNGVELIVEVQPEVRWSAYAVIRVRNKSDAPVHIPRHATSVLHDYQLKVRDASGQNVPTRMMLKLDEPGPPTTRLALQPGETHEDGVQLGMLFAFRGGQQYVLRVTVPVQRADQAEPTALRIDDARFTVAPD